MRLMRAAIWLAAAAALCPARGFPAEFDTGSDVRLRWDTTIRTSLALRLLPQDAALAAAANANDGDQAFAPGPISERVDVVSTLDVSRGDLGLDLSMDGWYDAAYHGLTARRSAATFNPVSVPYDRFPKAVRALDGDTAELLTAFVHDRVTLAGLPLTLRLGRQTLLWGESLFSTSNGIAAGMAPVDDIKALSQPLAEARELFLPVTQAVASLQLRPGLDLDGYIQAEWRADRLPGVSSYFSASDILDAGGERLLTQAGVLSRRADRVPHGAGQFGAALHLTTDALDAGLYALRFDAKSPEIFVTPADHAAADAPIGGYGLVYPRGIELYGASASTYLGASNLGGEISFRRNMPLSSLLPTLTKAQEGAYASGDTLHGQISLVSVLPPGRLWQGASFAGEFAANDRIAVTGHARALAAGLDRFAAIFRAVFTPQYFEVLPHLDLTVPVGFGLGLLGNSSIAGGGRAHAGDIDLSLNMTYRTVWQVGVGYTHFLGAPIRQPLADRDFLSLAITRTF